jgi:hypothetical protein
MLKFFLRAESPRRQPFSATMTLDALTALSPLDGRYAAKVEILRGTFPNSA